MSSTFYKTIFYSLAICTLTAASALALTLHQAWTYSGYTGEAVTIAWQPDETADHYELQLYHEDHHQVAANVEAPGTQATITMPRSGHYLVRLRSVDAAGAASTWHESTHPADARVDGAARGWQLFAWPAPAGEAEID
jgi:hypothetical protein